jgi:small subunit ribosomal protein S6
MRTYELVIVFDSSLEIEQIETDLKKLQDIITRDAGFVRVWERWGKRRLAYEIQRRQYGYYTLVVFDVEAELVNELDRSIRLTPAIIRHMITVVDPKRAPEVNEESVQSLGVAKPESTSETSEAGTAVQAKSEDEKKAAEKTSTKEATSEAASDDESPADKTAADSGTEVVKPESQDKTPDVASEETDKKTEDVA